MNTDVPINEEVRSKLVFSDYRFDNIEFRINPLFNFDKPIDVQFTLSAEIKIIDDVTKSAVIIVGCRVFKNPKENNYPFTIDTTISGDFHFEGDIGDDEFVRFCETSGIATLLPFIRTAITNISTIANLPPLVLPLLNVKNLHMKIMDE
ncbi:hypothetical protein JT05_05360 [Desulfosporosinus sp. Tol-M]|nr:hypothetical protein JT05_05360 [Desulfosporosinus sp. Tol-M]